MIATIKRLLGFGPSVNYAELVKNGGIIVDVRTKGEYASEGISKVLLTFHSINFPPIYLNSKIRIRPSSLVVLQA